MEVRILVIIISIAALSLLEYWQPAEKGQTLRGRGRNLIYISFYLVLGYTLSTALSPMVRWAHGSDGALEAIVYVPLIVAFIFLGDVLFYFYHRAQHTYPALWAIHELHHTEKELNATSSLRTHFLESPIQAMIIASPVIFLLHPPQTGLFILTPLLTFWLFFTHANIKLNLKTLTKVITGPQSHRIHHSIEEKHQNKNFAQFFPVIDILFGTYYHPSRDEFPETGLKEQKEITFKESLLQPFKTWTSLLSWTLRK